MERFSSGRRGWLVPRPDRRARLAASFSVPPVCHAGTSSGTNLAITLVPASGVTGPLPCTSRALARPSPPARHAEKRNEKPRRIIATNSEDATGGVGRARAARAFAIRSKHRLCYSGLARAEEPAQFFMYHGGVAVSSAACTLGVAERAPGIKRGTGTADATSPTRATRAHPPPPPPSPSRSPPNAPPANDRPRFEPVPGPGKVLIPVHI